MKILPSALLVLAIGAVLVSSAQARDSFSMGINVGGYDYSPPIVFYNPPVVYYSTAPGYYANNYNSAPVVRYRYSDDSFRGCRRGGGEVRDHHGWGHDQGEHHGWNRHGWSRGDDDDD